MGWRDSGAAVMNIVTKLSPECGHTRGGVLLSIEITKLWNYSFFSASPQRFSHPFIYPEW